MRWMGSERKNEAGTRRTFSAWHAASRSGSQEPLVWNRSLRDSLHCRRGVVRAAVHPVHLLLAAGGDSGGIPGRLHDPDGLVGQPKRGGAERAMSVSWDTFERYKQKGLDARRAGQWDSARIY